MASDTPERVITIDIRPFIQPLATLLAAVMISGSVIYSAQLLSKTTFVAGANTQTNTTTTAAGTETKQVNFTTNIDNDAIVGNRSAGLVIIEFAAYDCPYCNRHFTDVYSELKTRYVDTGKAFMVFRDAPLSGPDQVQANAAECTRKVAGSDKAYYQMHDYFFKNFGSNFTSSTVKDHVTSLGYNGDAVAQCVDNKEFKEEIAQDQAALLKLAQDLGSSRSMGVPSFVIGRVDADGNVTGTATVTIATDAAGNKVIQTVEGDVINGAFPMDRFEAVMSTKV